MNAKKIVLAGGSGLIGRLLTPVLIQSGRDIVVLTRNPGEVKSTGVRAVQWDAKTVGTWRSELEEAEAVINLTGRSINCRYTKENRRLILESRVQSTKAIGEAIAGCKNPPQTWLNASTQTMYKESLERPLDENAPLADDADARKEFLVEVAQAWEKSLSDAKTPVTRKIPLRMPMVFAADPESVFVVLRRLTKFGLGGPIASGRQYAAWIHAEDYCRAILWLLDHPNLTGPFNMAAPEAVTNRDMMADYRKVCSMPIGLPAARWMVEIGAFVMRTETELMIKSRRMVPGKLLASGFQFKFSTLRRALEDLEKAI